MSEQNFNESQNITPENEVVTDASENEVTADPVESDPISEATENEATASTPEQELPTPEESRKKKLLNIIDYIEIFVVGVCAVLVLFSFVFRICTVDGDSMNNTLQNGEKLIISDMFYTPDRGDVIVFHQTGNSNMPLVKRVIGLEGDTVTIDFDTWTVSIVDKNGRSFVLDEPYINIDTPVHRQSGTHTYVVPEGYVFVLGDNRNDSMDSTDFTNVGYVDCRRILGKVIFRYSPLDKFGEIE